MVTLIFQLSFLIKLVYNLYGHGYSMVEQLNKMSMADGAHEEEATHVSPGSHDPQQQQQQSSEEDTIEQFSLQAILPSQKPKQLHNRKLRHNLVLY